MGTVTPIRRTTSDEPTIDFAEQRRIFHLVMNENTTREEYEQEAYDQRQIGRLEGFLIATVFVLAGAYLATVLA